MSSALWLDLRHRLRRLRQAPAHVWLLAAVLTALPTIDAAGQSAEQYVHARWRRAEGLPQNAAAALAQTADGYVWIGTQSGLVRFDGQRLTVFDSVNTPALSVSHILALYAGGSGVLWIGTAGGGLVRLSDGVFTAFGTADGLPHQVITAIVEDRAGVLWVGTTAGIARLARGARQFTTLRIDLPSEEITVLALDPAGSLWIGTHRGLSRWQEGRLSTMVVEDGLPSNDVRALAITREGIVWVGTEGGLMRLEREQVTAYTTKDGLASAFVRSVAEDRDGVLWIGTLDGGLHRLVHGRIEPVVLTSEAPPDDIRALLHDQEGNLWIGTTTDGVHRIARALVQTYGTPEGLSHEVVLGTIEDAEGAIWLGTYGGGLNRFFDGRWTSYSSRDGLASPIVLSLATARDGGLWIGTRAGVHRLRAGGGITQVGSALGLAAEPVLSLLEDRTGALWIGTRTGVKRVIGTTVRTFGAGDGLASEVILAIVERRNGALLVGTEGGGLSRFDGERFITDPALTSAAGEIVFDITEDADDTLWLATNRGVSRVRQGQTRMLRIPALQSSSAHGVLEDGLGHVWISSNRGLLRVRLRDVDAFEAGELALVPATLLTEADGMRSAEVNGGIQPAGWRSRDGRLWFPTLKGVVVVDPNRVPERPAAPHVLVEEVRFDRALAHLQPLMTGGPGLRSLEFQYTAPTFQAADKVQFRHRLEGFDPEWVDAGSRRTASYTNIPPGDYRFRVSARISDGEWSDAEAVVGLHLLPHFSQTRTFYGLVIAAVGLMVFGLHRARVSGFKMRERELAALAEERRRALEALRESEGRFHLIFDNMREGVYRRDARGQLVLANRAYVEMLGCDRFEELAAIRAADLYADEASAHAVEQALAQAGEARNCDVNLRGRDGRVVAALESVQLERNERGEVVFYDGLVVNISARRSLEAQVRQLQKLEIVGRLAGAVAHDFNNLLTPIIGYAELASDELPPDSPVRADIDEIRRAAESASTLTRQLLAFSRQQVIDRKVIDLNDVTQTFERILRRLIGEHIEIRMRIDPAPLPIRADAGQIEQVLLNLAVNARDAMPTGGSLTVETSRVELDDAAGHGQPAGRYAVVTVRDTGVGMPAAVKARLFEPFFTTKGHGTGLGLSTLHDIVTTSGGFVEVSSEPGHGATFRVYLPYEEEAAVSAKHPTAETPVRASGTVLVVEDNPMLRQMIRRTLEKAGYEVLAARDAVEAERIDGVRNGPIDLLLTDVVLPGRSGPALAMSLTAHRPGMRVMYMTGYFSDDVEAHGLRRDSGLVLQKPFSASALLPAVAKALRQPDDARVQPPPAGQ